MTHTLTAQIITILFTAGIIVGIALGIRSYKSLKERVLDLEKKISQIKIDKKE